MHRMIRPLFAPFFQTCFLIGMVAAIPSITLFVAFNSDGPVTWSMWSQGLQLYLNPLIFTLTAANSFCAGLAFLRIRARYPHWGLSPGVWATFLFVFLGTSEAMFIGSTRNLSVGILDYMYAVLSITLVLIFSSIFVLPIGWLINKILDRAYVIDPTIEQRRAPNARAN